MSNHRIRSGVYRVALVAIAAAFAGGCTTPRLGQTQGEKARSLEFGYVPLDPLPVVIKRDDLTRNDILEALPDETMRMAIGSISGEGKLTYGPSSVGYEGNSYVVVVDYIKYNTKSLGVMRDPTEGLKLPGPNTPVPETTIPVYVGVGLRLTARLTVNKGEVNLGDLIAIGAAATSRKVSGRLVIQTLGISGEGVSSAIPIPTDINSTTIQSALMSLGEIKGKIYAPTTQIQPRVLGVYKNFGNDFADVNAVISLLLSEPVTLDTTTRTPNPLWLH